MPDEFIQKLKQHFTAAELVEFLCIPMSELVELLSDQIENNYEDLAEEVCFDFEEDQLGDSE